MAVERLSLKKEDVLERKRFGVATHYLIEWINQLTYLIFFVVLLTIFSMVMTFLVLLNLNAVISDQQTLWLYGGVVSSVFLGIVLIIAVQFKRSQFEQRVKMELK